MYLGPLPAFWVLVWEKGYMLAVKHPAITATGTLNSTEIGLVKNHRHGQIFRFVKKILKN
jgi:hypothetical protein